MAIKTKLEDMEIGDMIACRYKAGGSFSELGTCVAPELPVAGSANPDGLFYFRKVDTGLCIADRVVQHSISWDTLNGLGLVQGYILDDDKTPVQYESLGSVIGSPSYYGSFPATDAFTKNLGLFYASMPGYKNPFVGFLFKKPTEVDKFTIGGSSTSGNYTLTPTSWTIEGTDDGVEWYTLENFTKEKWAAEMLTYKLKKVYSCLGYRIKSTTNLDYITMSCVSFGLSRKILIRSLTGGNSYLNENGKSSLTDKRLGAFPTNNEWDKYIVKSTLNGTISAGDDKIWNWDIPITNWCQDVLIRGGSYPNGCPGGPNTRCTRGYLVAEANGKYALKGVFGDACTQTVRMGFRPVLEYLEPNSKATTLFY